MSNKCTTAHESCLRATERLNELLEQIERITEKIQTLGSSTHPLAVEATALYPEIDELRSWLPLFPGKHPKGRLCLLVTNRRYCSG